MCKRSGGVPLPVHQCYVRATVGTERMDAFSMKVARPEEGDADTADRIVAEAESYLTAAKDMAERDAGLQALVNKYREEIEKLRNRQAAESGESQEQARRNQRTKRGQNPGDDAPETADGAADEEREE